MKKHFIISFLYLVIYSLNVVAKVPDQGLSPLDVAKLKTVSDVIISPDGVHLPYLLSVPADPLKENKRAHSELHVFNTRQNNSTAYFTRGNINSISFRPQKNTVSFLGKTGDDQVTSLYEVSLAGGEPVKIFGFKTSIYAYSWAPDGKKVAIIASQPDTTEKISTLPYKPEIYEENLPFRRGYVVDLDQQEVNRIPFEGYFHNISWSPEGSKIAIATSETPLIDDEYMFQTLTILDAANLDEIAEIQREGKLGAFKFSPDGDHLAYIGGADLHDPTDGRLFVSSSQGGNPTRINPGYLGQFEDFSWKNNRTITFLASEGVQSVLGTVKVDGTNWKYILQPEGPNLNDLALANNGDMAFTGETSNHPQEVYLMKSTEDRPNQITNHNTWLKQEKLGKQEVIEYEARDGISIQGILIYPLDYQAGNKYPLITVVHGGPESHYNNGWLTRYSTIGQMGAAQGYMVFFPNYRGSTGRGEEFAKVSQGDLAGKEFDDIVDGVDYLIGQGLVDESKVGVTGGSYGGYATGWMATKYTDRFAAGVMFVGISNNISKWGTGDIPEELYLVHARKRIWEDYQFFLERSPIFYAGKANTPLLIMAGAEDTRVHPSQSIELYRHVKTRTDTPVRLVLYPGEGHGNTKATARLDYSLRQLRWFNKYLKNEPVDLDSPISLEVLERES
ncbi:MAG: S9 family peptidase [Candidatus Cyclobacteriaceae bacterium M3_2C_046]